MKKILLTLITLLILTTMSIPALALGPLDIDADLTVMSQYVWRGMVINSEAVLQPSASANILGIGFGFWGNMDLSDVNGYSGEFNELDYFATYSLPLPLMDLDFGLIYYDFPNTEAAATTEFYASGSVHVLLSPTLAVYYDFDEIDGSYVNASISHGVGLGETMNMDLGAALGFGDSSYNKGYFGVDSSNATDLNLSASIPFQPIPFLTITPKVHYSTLMGDPKTAVSDAEGDTDAFYYGLSATFSF